MPIGLLPWMEPSVKLCDCDVEVEPVEEKVFKMLLWGKSTKPLELI